MHWDFTLIFVFLGVAVPLLGRRRVRQLLSAPQTSKVDRLVLYGSTALFQWLAAGVTLWRIRAHGIPLSSLGVALPSPGLTAAVSAALAALLFFNQVVSLKRLTARPAEIKGVLPQLALKVFPQDTAERVAFVGLVITVAICEELLYRGFVQRVVQDWAGGFAAVGILGSAAMFSLAHLYQGRRGIISTCVVGLLFSAVRAWSGSLLAPFAAHFVADVTAGFLAPPRIRAALQTLKGDNEA
jgi:membrane protease YdiL (CAAX protease family)